MMYLRCRNFSTSYPDIIFFLYCTRERRLFPMLNNIEPILSWHTTFHISNLNVQGVSIIVLSIEPASVMVHMARGAPSRRFKLK